MHSGVQKILQFALAAVLLLAAGGAIAQENNRPPNLQKFEEVGGDVEFMGNAFGLDGWIITNPKNPGTAQYAYTTPEGAMLIGVLFAPDGELETKKQIKAFQQKASGAQAALSGAEKSSAEAEKFYAEAEKANWVAIGNAEAPYLYAFMNVNCEHCQAFWKDIESSVAGGRLQVRFVPFGEKPENRNGAAALLSSEHPDKSWRAYLAGDKAALGQDKVKEGAYPKVDANTRLISRINVTAPFTLYRRPADGMVTAVVGRPENAMLLLADFLK